MYEDHFKWSSSTSHREWNICLSQSGVSRQVDTDKKVYFFGSGAALPGVEPGGLHHGLSRSRFAGAESVGQLMLRLWALQLFFIFKK